jgi:hypothetical protein
MIYLLLYTTRKKERKDSIKHLLCVIPILDNIAKLQLNT